MEILVSSIYTSQIELMRQGRAADWMFPKIRQEEVAVMDNKISPQCTMGLSPLKSCIKEIKQNAFFRSHFLEISLFQTNYLAVNIYSVSLSRYICGRDDCYTISMSQFIK